MTTHRPSPADALRGEFDELARRVAGIELYEEDPDTFGYGHLVFYKLNEDSRIAFTEICDWPADDPERTVTGYSWVAERRSAAGTNIITSCGSESLNNHEAITAAAARWAAS